MFLGDVDEKAATIRGNRKAIRTEMVQLELSESQIGSAADRAFDKFKTLEQSVPSNIWGLREM
jgi:hypothetical protein